MSHLAVWALSWLILFGVVALFIAVAELFGFTVCILSMIITAMIGSYFMGKNERENEKTTWWD